MVLEQNKNLSSDQAKSEAKLPVLVLVTSYKNALCQMKAIDISMGMSKCQKLL